MSKTNNLVKKSLITLFMGIYLLSNVNSLFALDPQTIAGLEPQIQIKASRFRTNRPKMDLSVMTQETTTTNQPSLPTTPTSVSEAPQGPETTIPTTLTPPQSPKRKNSEFKVNFTQKNHWAIRTTLAVVGLTFLAGGAYQSAASYTNNNFNYAWPALSIVGATAAAVSVWFNKINSLWS